jgi:hypothetical protein
VIVFERHDREAAAVDGDAIGDGERTGERRGVDGYAAACFAGGKRFDGAEVFDDAGEHGGILTQPRMDGDVETRRGQRANQGMPPQGKPRLKTL